MALRYVKSGSWAMDTVSEVVTGGFSWNMITANALNNSLVIQTMYYGSSGLIDLGAGTDRLTLDFGGASNLDLRGVEFLDGMFSRQTTVNLLSPLGNALTTNGGIANIYGTGYADVITVTGNRGRIMQTTGAVIAGAGQNFIDLSMGDDRLVLVNDIDRTGIDRYQGGAGNNVLELQNTTAGTIAFTFTASDLDIGSFQTVYINNAGRGRVTASFAAQTESLLIYDALTTSLTSFSSDDTITAGRSADIIYARDGLDVVYGLTGNDTIYGGGGFDTISGGDGNDTIYGNAGTYNAVLSDPGNRVSGDAGADTFMVGYMDGPVGVIIPTGYAATSNPYGADVILDWASGNYWAAGTADTLVVSTAGVALIGGLYNDAGLGDADNISLRAGVSNSGLIIARGRDGNDNVYDSTGVDYLYGNKGSNQVSLSAGGNDRAYVDTMLGKQYINGFSSGDKIYLDKGVVNALGQNTARGGAITDASGSTSYGQRFNTGVDYLYANFYFNRLSNFGSGPYTNAQHDSANDYGDSGKTTPIGGGMVAAGAVLLACTFGLVGAGLVVAGGLLLVDAQQHHNITYGGAFNNNAYLNLMQQSRYVNTTAGSNDDGVAFLDFFLDAGVVGDGFTPVLELTNKSGAAGIYGLVAVHSDEETFIYLIRSADNLIENHEAMKIAEINGILGTSDFVIYDGAQDIYNPGTDPVLVLVEPTITAADAGASTAGADIANGGSTTADKATLTVSLAPALSDTTTIDLYDGSSYVTSVSRSAGSTSTTITDTRTMSASVEQVDRDGSGNLLALTGDNLFRYDYTYAYYSVWVNDPVTGFVTKSGVWAVTYMGIDPATVINGYGGFDTLMIEQTSDHLNGVSDANLLNIEMIDASGAEQGVTVTLTAQSEGFYVSGSDFNDVLTGGGGADTLVGNKGADQLYGGNGNDIFVYSALYDKSTVSSNGSTSGATVDFTGVQAFAADTVVSGGSGTDMLRFIGNVTLTDAPFVDASSVEKLDLDDSSTLNSVMLGTYAQAASTYYVDASNGADTINWDYDTLGVTIYGLGGDDTIDNDATDAVADIVYGGSGNDTIRVGGGDDSVYGDAGSDVLYGEDGNDSLTGGADGDTMTGGSGIDTFNADAGNDIVTDLGNGVDIVKVDASASVAATAVADWTATSSTYNNGTATITASGKNINLASVTGSSGWTITNASNATAVTLVGSANNDVISGGTNADTLTGGAGADTIYGNAGADTITGGAGADALYGNNDDDVFIIASAADHATGETIDGGIHTVADVIRFTGTSAETLTLRAGVTNVEEVRISNAAGATTGTTAESIDASAVTGAINLTGNDGANTLTGNASANTINAGAGNDTILAGDGNDTINAGAGNDTITGGKGQDQIDLSAGGNDDVVYAYADAAPGADLDFDTVGAMLAGGDTITFSGWTNRDNSTSRLLYETATLGANSAVSSATELLVVSNASVSSTGDLTDNIATALGSAFNVAGLDGALPGSSTGGGSDSTSLFAVRSNETGKWWVGRYVDQGNDDTINGSTDIAVYGLFETNDILNSFWQSTQLAPQQLGLTMPADTGVSESGVYTTSNTGFSVTGLQTGNQVYYSLDNGTNWSTGSANTTGFTLSEGTNDVLVRQVDSAGNYSPLSEITTATVVVDTLTPTVSGLGKSGSTVGYASYQAGLGDITLSWSVSDANAYDTVVQYKLTTSAVWTTVSGVSDATGNQSVAVNDLAEGTYEWRVTHTDKAGNSTTADGTDFTLTPPDITPPTYTTSNTFDANGYGYFAYTFSDTGSGINTITVNQADVEVRFQGDGTWYGEYNDGWTLVGNELRLYPRNFDAANPSASGPAYDTWAGSDHRALFNVTVTDNAGNQLLMNGEFLFDAGDVGYYNANWSQTDINSYLAGSPPSGTYA